MPTNATTFATLMTRVRQRADMVGSTFVSDAEIRTWLNSALAELHDIMILCFEDYYVNEASYTFTGTTESGTLPAAFYKALGVDFTSNGNTYTVKPFSLQERNMYNGNAGTIEGNVAPLRYQIRGDSIYFIPKNPVGTVTLYYAPECEQYATGGGVSIGVLNADPLTGSTFTLATTSDSHNFNVGMEIVFAQNNTSGIRTGGTRVVTAINNTTGVVTVSVALDDSLGSSDLIFESGDYALAADLLDDSSTVASKNKAIASGYEEYLVVSVAIKCLMKEESDVRMLLAEKADIRKRIENAAPRKDAGHPHKIIDVAVGTYSGRPINFLR